jgi:hypothetical protein
VPNNAARERLANGRIDSLRVGVTNLEPTI